MTRKLVAIVHGDAQVRERFAAALAEGGHTAIAVADADELAARMGVTAPVLAMAIVEAAAVETLLAHLTGGTRMAAGLPLVVFAGTVHGASTARRLATLGVTAYVNEHAPPRQILPAVAPLLYSRGFDRRAASRVAVAIPVTYGLDDSAVSASGTLLNLGAGGLALHPLAPVPPGAAVHVRCRLPGSGRSMQLGGRVVWADVSGSVGVQFESLGDEDHAAIDAFVESHAQAARQP